MRMIVTTGEFELISKARVRGHGIYEAFIQFLALGIHCATPALVLVYWDQTMDEYVEIIRKTKCQNQSLEGDDE